MKRTIQAGALTTLAIAVGVGVVLATPDYFHSSGLGTNSGVMIGEQSTPVENEVTFTGGGEIEASGDLSLISSVLEGHNGGVYITEDGPMLTGKRCDAVITACDSGWPVAAACASAGYNNGGTVWATTLAAESVTLDGTGGGQAVLQNGDHARLDLYDGYASLSNDVLASVELDLNGNISLTGGPTGNGVSVQLGNAN